MLKTQVIEKVRKEIEKSDAARQAEIDQLERATEYRLSDAIREASRVTTKATGWGYGDNVCALTAAYLAARVREYVD
jgi:hypothetical protein